jgi:hypothetical protein
VCSFALLMETRCLFLDQRHSLILSFFGQFLQAFQSFASQSLPVRVWRSILVCRWRSAALSPVH